MLWRFWKSCEGQNLSEGSNPSHCAMKIPETKGFRGFLHLFGKALETRSNRRLFYHLFCHSC